MSGPLADRIDIKLEVPAPGEAELMAPGATESSAAIRERVLRVARTIADLAGEAAIGAAHIAEAIQYRRLDASF